MHEVTGVKLPAGEYFVGDPCYVIREPLWMEWLRKAGIDIEPLPKLMVAEVTEGQTAVGVGTAWGDGEYFDQQGRRYPVDAGMIGAVPVDAVELEGHDMADGEGGIRGVNRVTFGTPFEVSYEDGTIVLGDVRINTEDDDDDDWRPEDEESEDDDEDEL